MSDDRIERIRARAHEIWEREGRPDGRDADHWRQASDEVDAEGADAVAANQAANAATDPKAPTRGRKPAGADEATGVAAAAASIGSSKTAKRAVSPKKAADGETATRKRKTTPKP
jgi:hypothetical protein